MDNSNFFSGICHDGTTIHIRICNIAMMKDYVYKVWLIGDAVPTILKRESYYALKRLLGLGVV